MKLVFQKNANGIELGFVECLSTKEADEFLNWFNGKLGNAPEPTTAPTAEIEEAEVIDNAPTQSVQTKSKVERSDVSQAAIALVQSKSREALTPILAKYGVKRIGEIRENDLADAFADIQQAQGAA